LGRFYHRFKSFEVCHEQGFLSSSWEVLTS
jgi:hypothetical protein